MKLPAKIIYAYKAVMELALRYNLDAPVRISIISESQGIPKKYLIQLLLRLKNANVVNSARGKAGGYFLARSPSQISLADVLKAVDDSIIKPAEKIKPGKVNAYEKLILGIWEGINKDIRKELGDLTIDQLLLKVNKEPLTYTI